MATIKLGSTKNGSALLKYAERRSEASQGVNCDVEYVRSQMRATRQIWGKNEGIQAHHIVQSFQPGEITAELANQIGVELGKKIAPGHEIAVYTHTDKEHIHNHIVINAVHTETGKKYVSHADQLYRIREASDELCKQYGLSVVQEPSALQRYHQAEYGLAKRGEMSWKDELRQSIDFAKENTKSWEACKDLLKKEFGIEVKERGTYASYKHPDVNRWVRGKTLGLAYERGTIEYEFKREIEWNSTGGDRESTRTERESPTTSPRITEELRTEWTTYGPVEGIHQRTDRQRNEYENGNEQRVTRVTRDQSEGPTKDVFNLERAREILFDAEQCVGKQYGDWKKRDAQKQPGDDQTSPLFAAEHQREIKQSIRKDRKQQQKSKQRNESRSKETIVPTRKKERGYDLER